MVTIAPQKRTLVPVLRNSFLASLIVRAISARLSVPESSFSFSIYRLFYFFVVPAQQVSRDDIAYQDRQGHDQHIIVISSKDGEDRQHPVGDRPPYQGSELEYPPGKITTYTIHQDKKGITILPVAMPGKDKDDRALRDPDGRPKIPDAVVYIGSHRPPDLFFPAVEAGSDRPDDHQCPGKGMKFAFQDHFQYEL